MNMCTQIEALYHILTITYFICKTDTWTYILCKKNVQNCKETLNINFLVTDYLKSYKVSNASKLIWRYKSTLSDTLSNHCRVLKLESTLFHKWSQKYVMPFCATWIKYLQKV